MLKGIRGELNKIREKVAPMVDMRCRCLGIVWRCLDESEKDFQKRLLVEREKKISELDAAGRCRNVRQGKMLIFHFPKDFEDEELEDFREMDT